MAERREQMAHLVDLATPGWAGEAEIVRTYWQMLRTRDRDVLWIGAQAYKETWHLRVLPEALQQEAWETGRVVHHPAGPEEAAKVAVEMTHFRMMAELAAELAGRPIGLDDLPRLAEEEKLQELRAPHRAGSALERAVVDFTEGGGGSMYHFLSRLDGDELERKIARVFRIVHRDEVFHGPAQIHAIGRLAEGPEDWQLAAEIVRKTARQRLRMRNEMFSFPLSEARLEEIADGKIEPWPMPVAF